jgi:DNA repair exonuclease SbcCD ATPase subunit
MASCHQQDLAEKQAEIDHLHCSLAGVLGQLANFEGVAEIIRDYQGCMQPWDDNEPVDLEYCRGCGGRGIRDGMEIARLTAICRKSDCGPLENEIARLRQQIATLEQRTADLEEGRDNLEKRNAELEEGRDNLDAEPEAAEKERADLEDLDLEVRYLAVEIGVLAVEIGVLEFLLFQFCFHTCQFSLRILQGGILHFVIHFLLCL